MGRVAPTPEWQNTVLKVQSGFEGYGIAFSVTLPPGEKEKEAIKIIATQDATIGWVKGVISNRMGIKDFFINLGRADGAQVDRSWQGKTFNIHYRMRGNSHRTSAGVLGRIGTTPTTGYW
jgi:hypothetical protein